VPLPEILAARGIAVVFVGVQTQTGAILELGIRRRSEVYYFTVREHRFVLLAFPRRLREYGLGHFLEAKKKSAASCIEVGGLEGSNGGLEARYREAA
jgi:hypothetical protein